MIEFRGNSVKQENQKKQHRNLIYSMKKAPTVWVLERYDD